jgi:hypothetical protein
MLPKLIEETVPCCKWPTKIVEVKKLGDTQKTTAQLHYNYMVHRRLGMNKPVMRLLGIIRRAPRPFCQQGAQLCPYFPGGALPFNKKNFYFFLQFYIGNL